MNTAKVLCLSLLTLMGSSLLGAVPIAKQAWPSEFLDQATTILGHLLPAFKRNPTGVRISYAARCEAARNFPLIPPTRLHEASRSNTALEAARIVFEGDSDVIVTSEEMGNVRIEIGNVPDSLLRTKIATLRLNEIEQYNPIDAIGAILAMKEVQKAAAALHLKPVPVVRVQLLRPSTPGAPHMPSILHNLTVDQILDMLAARFKGAVLYGVCTQGPQPRQFSIDYLDNDQWS
jgi:hypothetical protein